MKSYLGLTLDHCWDTYAEIANAIRWANLFYRSVLVFYILSVLILFLCRRKAIHYKNDDITSMIFVIQEIETSPKFSAMGFYTVDRSTLTATLGTIISYFIILFQTINCGE